MLTDLGYKVDCSFVPYTSFAGDGGPSFYGTSARPAWLDRKHRLLEVPLTSGYIGRLARFGRPIQPCSTARWRSGCGYRRCSPAAS